MGLINNQMILGLLAAFLVILFMIGFSFLLGVSSDRKEHVLPVEPCPIRARELTEQEAKFRSKMNGLEQGLFCALFDKYKCPENERYIRAEYFLSLTTPNVEGVSCNQYRLSEEMFKIDIDKLAQ